MTPPPLSRTATHLRRDGQEIGTTKERTKMRK